MKLTSGLFVHTVLLGLSVLFAGKAIQSLIEYRDGKVARSTQDMFDHYVTFPTISICIDSDTSKDPVGFEDTGKRPMNESLVYLRFFRHFKNGYVHLLLSVPRRISQTFLQ